MDSVLKYWPIIVVVAQFVMVAFILWVDVRAAAKVTSAVEPVRGEIQALTLKGAATDAQVTALGIRLAEAENDIDGLPSKADLERVLGEAKAAHLEASAANAGINRIEGMILERGMRDR